MINDSDELLPLAFLDDLPQEIVQNIFALLPFQQLLRCRLISKKIEALIAESVQLQYVIELGASGMEDCPTSPLTTSTKLTKLQALNQAWATGGRVRFRESIPIPSRFPSYDLQRGVLTLAHESSPKFRSVNFHKLPSWVHETERVTWNSGDLGMVVLDFTTDPSQDLIVYQEAGFHREAVHSVTRFRFRTMSSNKPHPLAANPVLQSRLIGRATVRRELGILALRGRYFLFSRLFSDVFEAEGEDPPLAGEIWIWDWQTGHLHYVAPRLRGEHATAFLDDGHIAIGRCAYEGEQLRSWWIEVVRIPSAIPDSVVRRYVKFHLPVFAQGVQCEQFMFRCDPNGPTAHQSSTPVEIHPDAKANSFQTSPSQNLLELSFRFRDHHGTTWPFKMYLLASALLSLFTENLQLPDMRENGVPFAIWGSKATRWFNRPHSNTLVCHLHGRRFVTLENPRNSPPHLSVFDFNSYLLARNAANLRIGDGATKSGDHSSYVTQSTAHAYPSIWSEIFESALPYGMIKIPLAMAGTTHQECDGVMLDEERIIVVNHPRNGATRLVVLGL